MSRRWAAVKLRLSRRWAAVKLRWAAWPRGIRRLIGGIAAAVLGLAIGWVVFEPLVHWLAGQDISTKPSEMTLDDVRGGC